MCAIRCESGYQKYFNAGNEENDKNRISFATNYFRINKNKAI